LVRDGNLVADSSAIRELALTAQRRVASAAGLLVGAGDTP